MPVHVGVIAPVDWEACSSHFDESQDLSNIDVIQKMSEEFITDGSPIEQIDRSFDVDLFQLSIPIIRDMFWM